MECRSLAEVLKLHDSLRDPSDLKQRREWQGTIEYLRAVGKLIDTELHVYAIPSLLMSHDGSNAGIDVGP
jgi:hypothetical protein